MFTFENTQGYSQEQLDELNLRLMRIITPDMDPSERDHRTERVLAEYDTTIATSGA